MLLFPSLHLRTGRPPVLRRGKESPRPVGLSGGRHLTWGVLLLLAALTVPASAQTPAGVSCPVSWSLKEYNVYLATSPTDPGLKVATVPAGVGPAATWSWPCPTTPGQYYLRVVAVNLLGVEGTSSPLVTFVILPPTPPPPLPPPPMPCLAIRCSACSSPATTLIPPRSSGTQARDIRHFPRRDLMALSLGVTAVASASAVSVTTPSRTTTAGSTIVLCGDWNAGGPFVSFTDSKGNTWTPIETELGSSPVTRMYYATNIIGGTA